MPKAIFYLLKGDYKGLKVLVIRINLGFGVQSSGPRMFAWKCRNLVTIYNWAYNLLNYYNLGNPFRPCSGIISKAISPAINSH